MFSYKRLSSFKKHELLQLFKTARPFIAEHGLIIKTAPINTDPAHTDQAKVLIVIPRKVGSAVIRNRIRRRIKTIFVQEKLYQAPFDFLILVQPPAANLSFWQTLEILKKCVQSSPS